MQHDSHGNDSRQMMRMPTNNAMIIARDAGKTIIDSTEVELELQSSLCGKYGSIVMYCTKKKK